jgi:hypothetical protein
MTNETQTEKRIQGCGKKDIINWNWICGKTKIFRTGQGRGIRKIWFCDECVKQRGRN